MHGSSPRRREARARPVVLALGIVAAIVLTVTVPPAAGAAEPSPTAPPLAYRAALTARLAKELRDPALAKQVVGGLDDDTLARFQQRVPQSEVRNSPLLAYRLRRMEAADVDSLVAFSFGNRVASDGTITAGPVNEHLAATIEKFVRRHPVPVFAQHEIAQILQADGVEHVTSIEPDVGPDGQPVYLSTAGVAEKIVAQSAAAEVALGDVGVIGFADHAVRTVLTARRARMHAAVPRGVVLAKTYDPQSGQPWTRSRAAYVPVDLIGRITTL